MPVETDPLGVVWQNAFFPRGRLHRQWLLRRCGDGDSVERLLRLGLLVECERSRYLDEILETMFLQQTIYRDFRETKGRPRVIYRLGGINEPIPSSPMTGELGK